MPSTTRAPLPGTPEFDAKVAELVAERRARADKYVAELRGHESFPDLYGVVIGMIRGVEYRAGGDDTLFRNEVVAILDAHERITQERLTARREEAATDA